MGSTSQSDGENAKSKILIEHQTEILKFEEKHFTEQIRATIQYFMLNYIQKLSN